MEMDNNIVTDNDHIENNDQETEMNEYFKWKKNSPFLYDVVMTRELTWPSITVEWLPDITRPEERDFSIQRLIIGSQTDGSESNYLGILTAKIPNRERSIEMKHYNYEKDEYGCYGLVDAQMELSIKINHKGPVNRARYLPQCPNVIATKNETPDIFIFDYTRHPSQPDPTGKCRPDLILKGHTDEGYGLSWCLKKPGILLSCSKDKTIQLWDLNDASSMEDCTWCNDVKLPCIKSSWNYKLAHNSNCCVEDISWHKFSGCIFGSVCNDGILNFWDSRISENPILSSFSDKKKKEMLCLDFSPFNEYLVATGCNDGDVCLWDMRYTSKEPFHILQGHKQMVTKVEWSPHYESLLGSSSDDRQVLLWDMRQIPLQKDQKPNEDLIFRHVGHRTSVMDFAWNKNMGKMVASVSYDNALHLWQPDKRIIKF